MAIEVTSEVLEALGKAARRAHPCEACGLLLGKAAKITSFIEAANTHPSPATHFEIDGQALIDAHRNMRAGGPELLGYFHSHPRGSATPSATDQQMAAGDGKAWAILGEDGVEFWRDGPTRFEPLSYRVIDG